MKKNFLLVLFVITTLIFGGLYLKQLKEASSYKTQLNYDEGNTGSDTLIPMLRNKSLSESEKQKRLKQFFDQYLVSTFNTTAIDPHDANDFKTHFDTSINIPLGHQVYPAMGNKRLCYTATWVDISGIRNLFTSLAGFDGIRIYPIRYNKEVTEGGETFPMNDINFMFVFTKAGSNGTHIDQEAFSYDYNHPCPTPPCTNY